MLSNSNSRSWLGHTVGLGSCTGQGWRRAARAVPALSGRAWPWGDAAQSLGLVHGVSVQEQPLCTDPPSLRVLCPLLFPFPERSSQPSVGISLFSPKSCHHVAEDYQYLVCSQTQRGTQRQSQTCRFTFAQPNSSCSEEKQVYTEGEVCCFVKVLLGWLSTENSLKKSLYIFL